MRYLQIAAFGVATLMCLMIATHGLDYLWQGSAILPPPPPPSDVPDVSSYEFTTPIGHYRRLIDGAMAPALYLHAGLGAVALLLAPLLAISGSLDVQDAVHRSAALVYSAAVTLSGLAGVILAFSAWGGGVPKVGFALMGVAWIYTLVQMSIADREWSGDTYRVWLYRNLAITFAGVTLRIWTPLLFSIGAPFDAAYGFAAWGSWLINLGLVELWMRDRYVSLGRRRAAVVAK